MKTAILLSSVSFALAYMNDQCETVIVDTDAGPVRINKSDYDANRDGFTLHRETKTEKEANVTGTQKEVGTVTPVHPDVTIPPAPAAPDLVNPVPPSNPSPNQKLVMKDGKKFFVVTADGSRVEAEGIDAKGYGNEQDAWNAILALPH